MNEMPIELAPFEPGWVWLVGAGPGDPGLISLYALHALRQADVVVYDALVNSRILDMAAPHARLEYAGKRGGRPSPTQPDICEKLVRFARENLRVLRLKGGDPFLFGRGGEEALALVKAGVRFRLVPGITSGIGGLAYAGIPATHRETNSAITFVTGHAAGGEMPDGIDWQALAKGSPVIVLYMALSHLDLIAERLLEAGRDKEEPVAIISKASTPEQNVLETTLSRCAEEARAQKVETPSLIVVGSVVRLRAGLDWLGAMSGKRLDPDPLAPRRTKRRMPER